MSYGIFESAATDNLEQEARQRQALGALDMAILSVRDSQGGWVTAAETKEDFEDRIALVKDDMRKSVEAHLMPVTGVMRKVVKALRDDWFDAHKARTAREYTDEDKARLPEEQCTYCDGTGREVFEGQDAPCSYCDGTGRDITGSTHAADSDKDRPELIPDGDFDGYLNEVDEGADGSHNFEPAEHDDTPKRGSAKTAAGWMDSGEFANYADSELEQAFWDTEGGPDHQKVVNEYENRGIETPSDDDDWDDEDHYSSKKTAEIEWSESYRDEGDLNDNYEEGYDDNSHEWKNADGLTEEEAILKEFYPDEWAKRNSSKRKQATGFASEEIEDMKNWAYQFGYISDTVLPTISSEDVLSIIKKDYPGGLIAWQQDGATQSPLDDVTMDMGMEPAPAADEVFASRDKTASDAQSLVDLCTRFDNGDQSVTVDQYDDALEQLEELASDGDSTASSYVNAY